jgi:hypothetical protein
LTRKFARFNWTPECQKAFDSLKNGLTMLPFLAFPDVNRPFTLYTDASKSVIGASLVQECAPGEVPVLPNVPNERPVYFLSHRLSKTQEKWPTIQREAYAIFYAIKKLRYFLHNAEFVIKTDHQPLKDFLNKSQDSTNTKIQSWMLTLQEYKGRIEFIAGKNNTMADMLSRIPQEIGEKENQAEDDDEEEVAKALTVGQRRETIKQWREMNNISVREEEEETDNGDNKDEIEEMWRNEIEKMMSERYIQDSDTGY